jgi:Na+-transporting methylmalonyl-CoA/oxaloacetate decarboxylase gamma subunit
MINELWSGERYSTEELNARLKFFIGIILGLTLFGIVFVVLYSLIFVTQPMNGMSPVDNKFFELIIPVATFLTGTLSGIMLAGDDKDLRGKAIDAANKPYTPPPEPPSVAKASAPESVPVGTGGFMTTTAATSTAPFDMPSFTPETGFGGKPAPTQPPHPEI